MIVKSRFEYKLTPIKEINDIFIDWLNEQGYDGWELVVVQENGDMIFKRELSCWNV